jgi:MazG family protein
MHPRFMGESFPAISASIGERFARLVEIMARLRAPQGCPWDREQTFESIKPFTLEETYEVFDAIDREDWDDLREELGDFLLQAVFYAQMASERGLFSISDSLDAINEKLVRRHPHVFADGSAKTSDDVKRRWDEIKRGEKSSKGRSESSRLDGVLRTLPALAEAQEIGKRAAKTGFDWPDAAQVLDKIREELYELDQARASASASDMEEEFGDLLFALTSLARHYSLDAEQSLRKASAKFRRRFAYVERALGQRLESASLEEMESAWQQAKRTA